MKINDNVQEFDKSVDDLRLQASNLFDKVTPKLQHIISQFEKAFISGACIQFDGGMLCFRSGFVSVATDIQEHFADSFDQIGDEQPGAMFPYCGLDTLVILHENMNDIFKACQIHIQSHIDKLKSLD